MCQMLECVSFLSRLTVTNSRKDAHATSMNMVVSATFLPSHLAVSLFLCSKMIIFLKHLPPDHNLCCCLQELIYSNYLQYYLPTITTSGVHNIFYSNGIGALVVLDSIGYNTLFHHQSYLVMYLESAPLHTNDIPAS